MASSLFTPDDYPDHLQSKAAGELEVADRITFLIDYGEDSFIKKYHPSLFD